MNLQSAKTRNLMLGGGIPWETVWISRDLYIHFFFIGSCMFMMLWLPFFLEKMLFYKFKNIWVSKLLLFYINFTALCCRHGFFRGFLNLYKEFERIVSYKKKFKGYFQRGKKKTGLFPLISIFFLHLEIGLINLI